MISHRLEVARRICGPGLQKPVFVMFYVTHRCNARCQHCFFWRELNQDPQAELTLGEIDVLAQKLGPVLQVTLTGGSPELRPELPEIARIFVSRCRPANITLCLLGYSTGLILAQVEEILKTCPNQRINVSLSLDALGEEYDRLRGLPGLFERMKASFQGLGNLKETYPQLNIACGMCVSGLNYQNVAETAAWAWENLPLDMLKLTLVRGEPKDVQALDKACVQPYLDLIQQEDRWIRPPQGARRRGVVLDTLAHAKEMMVRDLIRQIITTGQMPTRCSASRENVVIYADGTVGGCELRSEKLGNLRDVFMDLWNLWYSQEAQDFRQRIKAEKCSCCHTGFLSLPFIRSPRSWPRLAGSIVRANRGPQES